MPLKGNPLEREATSGLGNLGSFYKNVFLRRKNQARCLSVRAFTWSKPNQVSDLRFLVCLELSQAHTGQHCFCVCPMLLPTRSLEANGQEPHQSVKETLNFALCQLKKKLQKKEEGRGAVERMLKVTGNVKTPETNETVFEKLWLRF